VILHISSSTGFPFYLQLESQFKHIIASRALKPGDALPSVRKLAAQLRVNPNTVARAYQNLERDGVIRTVLGEGTYVAENVPGLTKSEKLKRLRPFATQIAVEGSQLQLSSQEILSLVEKALEELGERL
jgi:GntR family transcriptional regulator